MAQMEQDSSHELASVFLLEQGLGFRVQGLGVDEAC